MTLTNETTVGLVTLLIMCVPGLHFIIKFIRRHTTRPPQENETTSLELPPLHYEHALLESGMLYSTVRPSHRAYDGVT